MNDDLQQHHINFTNEQPGPPIDQAYELNLEEQTTAEEDNQDNKMPPMMQQMLSPVSVSDNTLSPGMSSYRPHVLSQQQMMDLQQEQMNEDMHVDIMIQQQAKYSDDSRKQSDVNRGQSNSYDSSSHSDIRTQNAPRQMSTEHYTAYTNESTKQHAIPSSVSEDSLETKQFRFLSQRKQGSPKKPQSNLTVQQQSSQSSLLKQFSEKVKSQAERLQKLDSYKHLCEKRILDFDPHHPLPVTASMIGSDSLTHVPNREKGSPGKQNSSPDMKRQLALKEQDLVYAKQRAEKAINENEYLKQELAKAQQAPSMQEKSVQPNEQSLLAEQIRHLEEEKNALLDYIEESVNQTNESEGKLETEIDGQDHRLTMNDASQKFSDMSHIIKQLEADKANLYQMTEDLKHQEGISRQKISELQTQLASQIQSHRTLSSQREETFGHLPDMPNIPQSADQALGLNTIMNNGPMMMTQGTEGTANPTIDYMVLDLNHMKQELAETQNQFESTREILEIERQEKRDLKNELEIKSARLNEFEQAMLKKEFFSTEVTRKGYHQAQNTQFSSVGGFEHLKTFESKGAPHLDEENQLHAQVFELSQKLDQSIDENKVLKETLDETQEALENLINEHEALSNKYQDIQSKLKEAQDQPGKLRHEAQGIRDLLDEKNNEVIALKDDLKNLSDQTDIQTETIRSLRTQNIQIEAKLTELKSDGEFRTDSQIQKLESTIDDLTRELGLVRDELTEQKDTHLRVEKELHSKLAEVDETHGQKSNLLRRIEDLNHEVRSLQSDKERKDERLKAHMKQNEELRVDCERLNIRLQQIHKEKEAHVDLRKDDAVAFDASRSRIEKQTKVINKICRDVSKVQDLVLALTKEFQLPNKLNPETASTSTVDGGKMQTKHLDEQLIAANSFLKQVGEWLVQFAKSYKQNIRKQDNLNNELAISNQKLISMETKCRTLQTDEQEAREKERFMAVEVQNAKGQLCEVQSQQNEGYSREERIHKQNQQLKTQLDGLRIQKDKLALQLKSLLAEKESLKETNVMKDENMAEQDERSKSLELQISTLVEQKHQILDLMNRAKEAFPSESLREVFAQIIETVHEGFQLEEEYSDTEHNLLSKEGELRQYAKREVDGLLSTKVINIRKDVDKGRQNLREISQQKEDLQHKQDQLEADLKNNEAVDRRRTDVALETESNLHRTKQELHMTKQELEFVTRNRADIEVALRAAQQEKAMAERELNALRHHLKSQAGTNSTVRNITSYLANKSELMSDLPFADTHTLRNNGEPQPTAKFPHHQLESYREQMQASSSQQKQFIGDGSGKYSRKRYPSYEPTRYSVDLLPDAENYDPNNAQRQNNHHPQNSDYPRQMPSLSEREGSNNRARAVLSQDRGMSSDNPLATTAAQSSAAEFNGKPLANKGEYTYQSARPPMYQNTYLSTSTGTKRQSSGQNVYSNPVSTSPAKVNPILVPQMPVSQYTTGAFPTSQPESYQSVHQLNPSQNNNLSANGQTLRSHVQTSGRSSSLAALHAAQFKHTSSIGEALQPIQSQYGGEFSSRTMSQHQACSHNNSPLPRDDDKNVISTDHKINQRRYSLGDRNETDYAKTAGNSTVNQTVDSSVQHKLSQLRNVFTSIRQNLQEDSMMTAQATLQQLHSAHRNHHLSSEMINNQEY